MDLGIEEMESCYENSMVPLDPHERGLKVGNLLMDMITNATRTKLPTVMKK